MPLFEPIFDALNHAGVRYVVVGGVAVVLHGYARFTADLDVVIDLSPKEAAKAVKALSRLGLKPRAPVDPMGLADAKVRRDWIKNKGMTVFSFIDPKDPLRTVDVFVEEPLPFEAMWRSAKKVSLGKSSVRIASIDDLISLKRRVGRPQDLADVEALTVLKKGDKA